MKCKTDFSSLIIIKHFKVLHIPQCQLYFTFYFHHARPESKKRDRQIDKEWRETGLQVYKTRQTDCIPVQYGQRLVHNREQAAFCLPVVTPSHAACVCVSVFFMSMCVIASVSLRLCLATTDMSVVCVYFPCVNVC